MLVTVHVEAPYSSSSGSPQRDVVDLAFIRYYSADLPENKVDTFRLTALAWEKLELQYEIIPVQAIERRICICPNLASTGRQPRTGEQERFYYNDLMERQPWDMRFKACLLPTPVDHKWPEW